MLVDNVSSRSESESDMALHIFKPFRKLCKVDKRYEYIEGYHNLSKYRFTQEEKDSLCECISNGKDSIIGTTNKVGQPRLTLIGVERRYKVKSTIISKWLDDYREKMMKEAFDIVNGVDHVPHPIKDKATKKKKKRAAVEMNNSDDYLLLASPSIIKMENF